MNKQQFFDKHKLQDIQQQEMERKWRHHLYEQELQQMNRGFAIAMQANAAGGGAGGGVIPITPSYSHKPIPPNSYEYIPFDQYYMFVMTTTDPSENYQYLVYNYSGQAISDVIDSGIKQSDYFLRDWYPSNDGFALLIYGDVATNQEFIFVVLGPDANPIFQSETYVSGSTINFYYAGGFNEDGTKSGIFYAVGTQNVEDPSLYDYDTNYFYNRQHYQWVTTGAQEMNWDDSTINGVATFRFGYNGSPYTLYRMTMVGPNVPPTTIETSDPTKNEIIAEEIPYVWYTQDEKFAYGYDGYLPDFKLFYHYEYLDNHWNIRGLKLYKDSSTSYWDMYSAIDGEINAINGGSLSTCDISNYITGGDNLWIILTDYSKNTLYSVLLKISTKTVTSIVDLEGIPDRLQMQDMLNGTSSLKTFTGNHRYDNYFEYSDSSNVIIQWNDGTVEVENYTDGTRIQAADITKDGLTVTWFTKPGPAQGTQIQVVRKYKGTAKSATNIEGFLESNSDNRYYFYYDWIWDLKNSVPLYNLVYMDYSLQTATLLPCLLDGTFDVSKKFVMDMSGNQWVTFNDNYGYHQFTYVYSSGLMQWFTMNLDTQTWSLTFEDTASDYNYTWDNVDYAYGSAHQKKLFLNISTYLARIIKRDGVVAQGSYPRYFYDSVFGFSYQPEFFGPDNANFYVIDTEDLTAVNTLGLNYEDNSYDVDRAWFFYDNQEYPYTTRLVNGPVTVDLPGLYPYVYLYNDILLWND